MVKKIISILLCLVCLSTVILTGCSNQIDIPADSTDWHDMQFYANDVRINLKEDFTADDLRALGCKLDSIDYVTMKKIEPGEGYMLAMVNDDKTISIGVKVINTTDEKILPTKLPIHAILGGALVEGSVITLANGVTNGTTYDEVVELMGGEGEYSENTDTYNLTYQVDEAQGRHIRLVFDNNDEVVAIVLQYDNNVYPDDDP